MSHRSAVASWRLSSSAWNGSTDSETSSLAPEQWACPQFAPRPPPGSPASDASFHPVGRKPGAACSARSASSLFPSRCLISSNLHQGAADDKGRNSCLEVTDADLWPTFVASAAIPTDRPRAGRRKRSTHEPSPFGALAEPLHARRCPDDRLQSYGYTAHGVC